MRRSSIEGSPARLRTLMFVTLSCHLIFMIDRRCLIMKACSFFPCLLYTDMLPMSGSTRTSWKYDDERCVMVMWSQKKHVLFDCNLDMDVRRRWKEKMDAEHADVYDAIKGYDVLSGYGVAC